MTTQHGYVVPREDGFVNHCGGVMKCRECQEELRIHREWCGTLTDFELYDLMSGAKTPEELGWQG